MTTIGAAYLSSAFMIMVHTTSFVLMWELRSLNLHSPRWKRAWTWLMIGHVWFFLRRLWWVLYISGVIDQKLYVLTVIEFAFHPLLVSVIGLLAILDFRLIFVKPFKKLRG